MGAHPVPYDFSPFLDALDESSYVDRILVAWLKRHDTDDDALLWLDELAREAATSLREIADFVERPENHPRLAGKGPYDNDPQQVVLPAETWEALAAVHGSGLWRDDIPEAVRYAAVYILNQNGEAGVACSVACTDGLRRVLARHRDDARSEAVLDALENASPEDWVHGAQFVTEIQGGSDAAANVVSARRVESVEEETWSLWGQKWFCSNLTADYWLVTARPEGGPAGAKGVALFCVPRDQDGYTIERLKDKLGTRALPTAEILFRGAKAWRIGPLQAGLKTMVGDVLVTSRIHNIVAAAAFLRRAAREARAYAGFRTAFEMKLEEMPLIAETLERLERAADHAEAGAFATVDAWLAGADPAATDDQRAFARILVSLQKAVATRRLVGHLHEAMMLFGGNGIEERFTALPRLWRDAAILETWEGPYTLLLMQALSDLKHFQVQGREEEFLRGTLGDASLAVELSSVLDRGETRENLVAWRGLAHCIVTAWEERALKAIG